MDGEEEYDEEGDGYGDGDDRYCFCYDSLIPDSF